MRCENAELSSEKLYWLDLTSFRSHFPFLFILFYIFVELLQLVIFIVNYWAIIGINANLNINVRMEEEKFFLWAAIISLQLYCLSFFFFFFKFKKKIRKNGGARRSLITVYIYFNTVGVLWTINFWIFTSEWNVRRNPNYIENSSN